jgi:Family of unknown function (DUF5683)
MLIKKLVYLSLLLMLSLTKAQDIKALDSVNTKQASITKELIPQKILRLDPLKAGLYSAIIPGLGQYYNHKYWKIPLAVGLIGTGVSFILYFDKQYQRYRSAYLNSLIGLPHEFSDIRNATKEVLANVQNSQKRYRDYATVVTIGIYALNIMDAIVDAHLDEVKKDPDLAFKPTLIYLNNQMHPGMGLSYNF